LRFSAFTAFAYDVLRAYAHRYFAASPERAADWAKWLAQWGDRRKAPLPAAAEELACLSDSVKPTWRVEHRRCKAELETLDVSFDGSSSPGA
jgi:hypothetical protein